MEKPAPSPVSAVADPRWILLVDDEAAIISMVQALLTKYGFQVRGANNGDAAMAALDAAATPPVLLICDVLMPGIDGLELTRRILARLPELKVIFISGHLTDVSWWPADLRGHRFVPKPFTLDQLSAAVEEVLEERGATG